MLLDIAKIKLAAARKVLTMRDVRKLAHLSEVTMRRINAGKEVIPKTAGKLASALGVDVTEIMKS